MQLKIDFHDKEFSLFSFLIQNQMLEMMQECKSGWILGDLYASHETFLILVAKQLGAQWRNWNQNL